MPRVSKDFKYFERNYDALYKEHGDCFVVIKNQKVIGTYKKYIDGVKKTALKHKPGSYIVQELNKEKTDIVGAFVSSVL